MVCVGTTLPNISHAVPSADRSVLTNWFSQGNSKIPPLSPLISDYHVTELNYPEKLLSLLLHTRLFCCWHQAL